MRRRREEEEKEKETRGCRTNLKTRTHHLGEWWEKLVPTSEVIPSVHLI